MSVLTRENGGHDDSSLDAGTKHTTPIWRGSCSKLKGLAGWCRMVDLAGLMWVASFVQRRTGS